jgi:Zn-dependent protease with chaperone function
MSLPLEIDQLKLKKEETYFVVVAVLAALCWLVVVVTIIPLIYGLLISLFVWLAHGLVIAHLQSESVLVTERQMPVLHRTYLEVVERLQLAETPPLYIMQAHGLLNAFATRRSGRHFVVVYSDMLEACGEDTAQIRFLLGHELGHVRSNHLFKKMFLLPGLLFPLIGSAYSRACEGTCDRYGAFASDDIRASAQAMLILAGGKRAWLEMDPEVFSQQYRQQRGFFVSWHELTSGYPTLSQRTYNLLTLDTFDQPVGEPRHPLAYVFGFFSVGGKHGSGGNLLVTVAMVAILVSIALPAFTGMQKKANMIRSMSNAKAIGLACEEYARANGGNFPPSLDVLTGAYLPRGVTLSSPLNPADPVGYTYTPGLKDTDPSSTILLEDKYAPVVVYVDDSAGILPSSTAHSQ